MKTVRGIMDDEDTFIEASKSLVIKETNKILSVGFNFLELVSGYFFVKLFAVCH